MPEKSDKLKANKLPKDIATMNFEDAVGALEEIVRKLEGGQVSLEDSIDIYTRGTQLRQYCDSKLKDAQMRIEKITKSQDGVLGVTELDGQ